MEINFTPQKATAALFKKLEAKGLIKRMLPSKKALESKTRTGVVDVFYNSRTANGAHKLICVGKRSEKIKFSWHADNEDFLLIKPPKLKYKPLYMVIALCKIKEFLKKDLGPKDFVCIELNFNDPYTSFFTMLKGTVHAELTAAGGNRVVRAGVARGGQHPVFFVTEPSKLKDNKLKIKNYSFRINEC